MKTYPIALELTVWFDLGLNQYEVVIDEVSKISVKRTDDVLHSRVLNSSEVQLLLDAIGMVKVPVTEETHSDPSIKASSSYELIIESAHFSLEFNWENLDVEASSSNAFESVVKLASLVQSLDLDH
jgi:predicted S18 family serine protease